MTLIEQLQSYLRESARQRYEALAIPPFTLFFHPTGTSPFSNYAIPDVPCGGDLSVPLAGLREAYEARGRMPRFEFVADYAPALAAALEQAGFKQEDRTALMICTPESYRAAPEVPGLAVVTLGDDAALEDVRAVMDVQHEGFGGRPRPPVSDQEVIEFRRWLAGTVFVLARLDGVPVSAGSLMPPIDGVAEVAGIATLAPYRRRGIAAALTDYALQAAFAHGVTIATLTAANERAGRVYERVGFRHIGTALAYIAFLHAL